MKGKPVLAGVDGSTESFRAAALAWRVARAADVECVLVYAVPAIPTIPPTPEMSGPSGVPPVVHAPDLAEALIAHLRKQIETELAGELPVEVRQSLVARLGRPGVVLDEVARETRASLVVVGWRHHGALARGLGGSTAHHLVRTSPAAVLIVAGSGNLPRRVLVATDLFDGARPTLAVAGRYARLFEAQLRVVHVVEPAKFPTVVPLSLDQDQIERNCREEFQRLIEEELPNVAREERVMRRGRSDEEIADEVAVWGADLLVVGSHGKGWINRLLIGSTTERLLNRLPTSLLVVPVERPGAQKNSPGARKAASTGRGKRTLSPTKG